jgi:cobalamin synthase
MEPAADQRAAAAAPDRPTRWGGFMSVVGLLLPTHDAADERTAARAWIWFLPVGVLVGTAWLLTFRVAWRIFGEMGDVRLMPAVAVMVIDLLFVGRRLRAAALNVVETGNRQNTGNGAPRDSSRVALWASALLLIEFALLASLPEGPWFRPDDWRRYLIWAYPDVIYRPLLLAPIWSAWGVLLAAGVGRMHPQADPFVTALGRSSQSHHTFVTFVLVAGLTSIYCVRRSNAMLGLIISLVVFAATFVASAELSRRRGGHTRDSLLSTGYVARLAFLICYVGFSETIQQW